MKKLNNFFKRFEESKYNKKVYKHLFITSAVLLSVAFSQWGMKPPILSRAESIGGTKTKVEELKNKQKEGIYYTKDLTKTVEVLVAEANLKDGKEDVEIKLAKEEPKETEDILENYNKEQIELLEVNKEKVVDKKQDLTLINLQSTKPINKELNTTNLTPSTGKDLNTLAEELTKEPSESTEIDENIPNTGGFKQTNKIKDLGVSSGLVYPIKENQGKPMTYYKDINFEDPYLNVAVLTNYTMPLALQDDYWYVTGKYQVAEADTIFKIKGVRSNLEGYVNAKDVVYYSKPKVTETPSIPDRDFIKFDKPNQVIDKVAPFGYNQEVPENNVQFTIRKDTTVNVISTLETEVPMQIESFVVAEAPDKTEVFIPRNSVKLVEVNDKQVQMINKDNPEETTMIVYTDKELNTNKEVNLSDCTFKYLSVDYKENDGKVSYYKFHIVDTDKDYYVPTNQVQKQHYGFAAKTEADNTIYRIKISTELLNEPKGYKNAKVLNQIEVGKYVKAKNKITVTNTDESQTEWLEVTDNGKTLGFIEANKVEEMSKDLTVKATIIDDFIQLAKTYQLTEEQLKEYNPEIAIFGQPKIDDIVYLYPREGLDKIVAKYKSLDDIFDKLEITDKSLQKKMVEAKDKDYEVNSKLVKRLGYLIPYIKDRGFLPSVTFAQATIESADGDSGLSKKDKNLFGIKGSYKGKSSSWSTGEEYSGKSVTIVDGFRSYPTEEESVKDYLDLLERSYGVKGITDYTEAIKKIKAGGYATSSSYVSTLVAQIERLDLAKLDK